MSARHTRLAAAALLTLLAGCGQTGPLYMPNDQAARERYDPGNAYGLDDQKTQAGEAQHSASDASQPDAADDSGSMPAESPTSANGGASTTALPDDGASTAAAPPVPSEPEDDQPSEGDQAPQRSLGEDKSLRNLPPEQRQSLNQSADEQQNDTEAAAAANASPDTSATPAAASGAAAAGGAAAEAASTAEPQALPPQTAEESSAPQPQPTSDNTAAQEQQPAPARPATNRGGARWNNVQFTPYRASTGGTAPATSAPPSNAAGSN